jgi:hypothetical protein
VTSWIEDIHLVDDLVIGALVWVAWTKWVVPLWRVARWGVHEADDREILKDIAGQFRPNAGHSLRDVIDQIRLELAEIRDEQKATRELVNVYLLSKQRGGRRHYDEIPRPVEDSWDDSDTQD